MKEWVYIRLSLRHHREGIAPTTCIACKPWHAVSLHLYILILTRRIPIFYTYAVFYITSRFVCLVLSNWAKRRKHSDSTVGPTRIAKSLGRWAGLTLRSRGYTAWNLEQASLYSAWLYDCMIMVQCPHDRAQGCTARRCPSLTRSCFFLIQVGGFDIRNLYAVQAQPLPERVG